MLPLPPLRQPRIWLLATIWLAAALRFHGLWANSFHADEALFASWARLIAVWRDPLLWSQAVDKPPLLFYLQALFYPLQGPVEWAARLPDFIASLLLIPLTARLAQQLYHDPFTALLAALLVALSPLAIQFSPTAFTDPLLTFWLLLALVLTAAGEGRSPQALSAGLAFGLAAVTKYQAALFLPLIVGLALYRGWQAGHWRRWIAGVALVLLPLLAWQGIRPGAGGTLVAQQWVNFGGVRLSRSWELGPRLVAWADLSGYLVGSAPLLLLPFLAARGRDAVDRRRLADWLIALFVAGYGLLHWLLAIPVWDRYLLPIVPLLALLVGRAGARLARRLESFRPGLRLRPVFLVVLLLVMAPGAAAARAGRFPIGGGPTADGGAAEVAAFLAAAPYGTVLYDHWYHWQWRYHLFDRRVYVSWFPHPAGLVADLAVFGDDGGARYLVLPATGAARPVERAVTDAGFRLRPAYQPAEPARMILYEITRP